MTLPIVCPTDRQILQKAGSDMKCGECGRVYPVRGHVVCTLDRPDEFYEGAYDNHVRFMPSSESFRHAWPLWLINSGYLWTVRRYVQPGATVVELGCAGGVSYFGSRFRMVGCDVSMSSLAQIVSYERCVQADASACVPLADGSVDAVVSSYFWEHIPPATKPKILAECRRILRPGGTLIFLYDVETNNPLIRHFKERNSFLYEELFLRQDGHAGYEYPSDNLAMFQKSGFRVVEHREMEKTWVQSPSVYSKLARWDTAGARIFGVASRLGRSPFFYVLTAALRLIDTCICPWLPSAWARIQLAVCERTAEDAA